MIPPYRCMFNCHTGTASTSTLRDPQGKAEPTIGGFLAILEELETVVLSDKAYAMELLKC
ncbi:hypothetical protein H8356DRAFT_1346062 [Neocallimastix lanati (nom. inval.)]|nr:hypothetical protein H8356DRAFT_1346062 [Neocallimastix sp. JGI-2020a]